jgi:putative FmdB family regulatory protein
MPIYEYVCRKCGQEFEALIRGQEKASCPGCGGGQLTKKISVAAGHVRGGSPACPAREMGACNMPTCGGGGCGLTQFG